MYGCDDFITLWSREKDEISKKESFVRVDIPVRCKWRRQSERAISGTGASASDTVVVIIPHFAGLNSLAIKPGDRITLGRFHSYDKAFNSLIEVREKLEHMTIMTVMKTAYNYGAENYGNMRGRHIRVEGK